MRGSLHGWGARGLVARRCTYAVLYPRHLHRFCTVAHPHPLRQPQATPSVARSEKRSSTTTAMTCFHCLQGPRGCRAYLLLGSGWGGRSMAARTTRAHGRNVCYALGGLFLFSVLVDQRGGRGLRSEDLVAVPRGERHVICAVRCAGKQDARTAITRPPSPSPQRLCRIRVFGVSLAIAAMPCDAVTIPASQPCQNIADWHWRRQRLGGNQSARLNT